MVECEDLTAAEFAVLAAIVEINESGQLGVFGCPVPKNEIARDRCQVQKPRPLRRGQN